MKTKPILAVLASGLLLSGCAGLYDQKFDVMQYSPSLWRVGYNGDSQKMRDLALLRASEITLANHHRYFLIVSSHETDNPTHLTTPAQAYTSGTASGTVNGTDYGGMYNGTAQLDYSGVTTFTPAREITLHHFHTILLFRTTDQESADTVDASFISPRILARYHIKLPSDRMSVLTNSFPDKVSDSARTKATP